MLDHPPMVRVGCGREHYRCATGEETLSWAVAGVQATGVDISDTQIALAERKAADVRRDARVDVAALAGLEDVLAWGGGARLAMGHPAAPQPQHNSRGA